MSFRTVIIFTLFTFIRCDNILISTDCSSDNNCKNLIAQNSSLPVLEYNQIAKKVERVSMNINKYIDFIVNSIRLGGKNIEPIPLPDVTEKFEDKILFVYVNGEFIMRNGNLRNIKSISRFGNATLRYENYCLYVDTAFRFDRLDFDYDFISKIVSVGPYGYMNGDVKQFTLETVFTYDIFHSKMSLNKTQVTDKLPVDVNVQVSKAIDWLANPIINWLSDLYEDKILYVIQDAIKDVIERNLPSNNFLTD